MVFWWIIFGIFVFGTGLWVYAMCSMSSKLSRQEEAEKIFQEDLSEDLGLISHV